MFVVPFDLSHFQKAFNELDLAAITRIARGGFVLSNVAAFKFSRAIHGREPTHHMAKQGQCSAHNAGANLAITSGAAPEFGEHLADELAMTPFVFLDGANRFPFIL